MITNFLNALDRIPKLMEQYKSQNATIEKDLPTLREIVGGTWKKEEELKGLKSELSAIERKIQLELVPPEKTVQMSDGGTQEEHGVVPVVPAVNENNQFLKDHVIISRPKFSPPEITKGFKI